MNPIYKKIHKKKWYHQRFDGSPMFIFAIADAEMLKEKRKPKGNYPKVRVCFFEDGKADWHLDQADINLGSKAIIKLAKKDKQLSTKLLKAWKKDEIQFDEFFWKEFPKINLKKLSKQELLALWKKYYLLAIKRLSSTGIIDHFALGSDGIINDMLKTEIKKLNAGKELKDSEFSKIFSIATAPVHQSFINQAEIDLLKIATGQSKEKISDYQQRYYWINNNYVTARVLSVGHFKNEIKIWKKSAKKLKAEIIKLEKTPWVNQNAKKELFKKYKFSSLLKTLLKISEDFTLWQDERKRATYFNIAIGCKMLEEISRRIKYPVEVLKYATASEIEDILTNKNPSLKNLSKRLKGSVFVISPKNFYVATGKEVEKIRKIMFPKTNDSDINDFRGLSASTGRAKGKVKILKSATEVSKVQNGDILVAVMTRPDYIAAMKKAVAIITDEGGITSHAAIVSRELGIPCIIGTKIATHVLKDGDIVEVDANHGWIKKIK